ncbi:DUF1642 domain-containing protein [Listeria booriae]|uniref:DUF1642 domain-containing protein n=1 Tax=Listeria booriae TaxID=1552123 RepID=A0A7X0Z8Z5_9LIST|nr:DUF1642 domain-containing protein [Listeria booriae]MBC2178185.1 DUF1642 domain-containing protein [Listeria booriae]MBC2178288.1 DUF1642 domain-containing protein [Listeria booriae]
MTKKFNVGDRVQCIIENEHLIGTIKKCPEVTEMCASILYAVMTDDGDIVYPIVTTIAPAQASVMVPQNVGDYISSWKGVSGRTSEQELYFLLERHYEDIDMRNGNGFEEGSVGDWIQRNFEQFIIAVLNGYEIDKTETEPLYEIVIVKRDDRQLLFEIGYSIEVRNESDNEGYWKQQFTEAEILKIDKANDTNYRLFAVRVEEVE